MTTVTEGKYIYNILPMYLPHLNLYKKISQRNCSQFLITLKIHLLVELDAVVGENQDFSIPCGTAMTELERDCHALTTTARGGTAGCQQVLEHSTQTSGCSLMF